MDQRITLLESTLAKTGQLIETVGDQDLTLATPCTDFDVAALLDHVAVWVQVFDSAVTESEPGFDPVTHHVTADWAAIFAAASESIVDGLRERGFDRPMTMTTAPLPGEFVLNMVLMEYVGHGWDLARAIERPIPYCDAEATAALTAAQAILQPQYRGSGMFDAEIAVPSSAAPIDRYVAFVGRDPGWTRTAR